MVWLTKATLWAFLWQSHRAFNGTGSRWRIAALRVAFVATATPHYAMIVWCESVVEQIQRLLKCQPETAENVGELCVSAVESSIQHRLTTLNALFCRQWDRLTGENTVDYYDGESVWLDHASGAWSAMYVCAVICKRQAFFFFTCRVLCTIMLPDVLVSLWEGHEGWHNISLLHLVSCCHGLPLSVSLFIVRYSSMQDYYQW